MRARNLPVSLRLAIRPSWPPGRMIRADGETIWNGTNWRMDVTDEAGDRLFTLRFSADDYGPRA
jgi:hypothetical protein